MSDSDLIGEFKKKCRDPSLKNEPTDTNHQLLREYLKTRGIDVDNVNVQDPEFILTQETIDKGKSWKTDMYCIKQTKYDKENFPIWLKTFQKHQDELKNCKGNECWKSQIDGYSFKGDVKAWCSTNPNTILPLAKKLQTEHKVSIKNEVPACNLITGIPVYYRELTPEGKEVIIEQKPYIDPKILSQAKETPTQGNKKAIGIIHDQTTEFFIPTDTITNTELRNIERAIDNDEFKPDNDKLVTYFVPRFDRDTNKYVKDKYSLMKKCYKDGQKGYCASIGLMGNIQQLFKEANIDLTIDDQRKLPTPQPFELKKTILVDGVEKPLIIRDYQQNIINEAKEKGHGIVEIATGGGKTIVASGIIGEIGQDTAFIVPNNSLFYNAKQQIGSYVDKDKVNIGQVGGMNVDYKNDPDKVDINIISLPLAALAISNPDAIDPEKRKMVLQALKDANMIIFDEAHHISADTYKRVAQYAPAKYRFGLSATAFRDDGKTLEIVAGVGGTLGAKIKAQDLIKRGYLTPPEIYVINNEDITPKSESEILDNLKNPKCNINPETKMFENVFIKDRIPSSVSSDKSQRFRYIEKGSIECNEPRNERILQLTEQLNEYGKTKVIFVNSVEHGKKLQQMFEEKGIYSEILTGDTESQILKKLEEGKKLTTKELAKEEEEEESFNKKRAILFDKMQKGELKTIIATDKIMGEGVDIPAIDSLILTNMRKSRTAALQMVGRALRKKEGKEKALIFDFRDPNEKLNDWRMERIQTWRNEQFPVKNVEPQDVNTLLQNTLGEKTKDMVLQKEHDLQIIERKNIQKQYEALKLPELKQKAKEKGIKITGLKKDDIMIKLMALDE